MLGKGVRYSSVYQEKGQAAQKTFTSDRILGDRGPMLLNTDLVFIKEPFPYVLMVLYVQNALCALNRT